MHKQINKQTVNGVKHGLAGKIIFTVYYKSRSTPHRMERQMAKMKHDKAI